jgi:hypothetical protein
MINADGMRLNDQSGLSWAAGGVCRLLYLEDLGC